MIPQSADFEARMDEVRRFIGERCVLHPALVLPLRVLWRDYQAWGGTSVQDLKFLLDESPWARVTEPKGKGLIRVVVHGVGLRSNGSS